jgi:hypothetical protein
MSTATQTYQQGIQNLQAWLDFLAEQEDRLQTQLVKMQGGGQALPDVDADLPPLNDLSDDVYSDEGEDDEEVGKW